MIQNNSGIKDNKEVGIIEITTESESTTALNTTKNSSDSMTVSNDEKDIESNNQKAEILICEIKGEVKMPGVYELKSGSRVNDLLNEAGGLKTSGTLKYTNLARKLSDGEAVYIPPNGMSEEEYINLSTLGGLHEPQGANDSDKGINTQGNSKDLRIDINRATAAELETLPGVGPVTAANIISYREKSGGFKTIEELKNVDRIGDKTYEKLKEHIRVK